MQSSSAPESGYTLLGASWKPGEGVVDCASTDDFFEALKSEKGIHWAHVQAFDIEKTDRLLRDQFHFHPLAIEDALNSHERPGVQESDHTLFLEATAITPGTDEDEYSQVSFFLQPGSLITVCIDDFPMADLWKERWKTHPDEFGATPVYLLHSLLDAIVDEYFPATDMIQASVEDLEDRIYTGNRASVQEVLRIKRRLLEMRRHLTPLRDVVNTLLRRDVTLVPQAAKPYFQDIYDHVLRLTELIDLNRDILTTVLDAQLNIASNRLNEVMRVMTVLATLLMTGALVAGIYGMNFEFMPELHWRMGYPFAIGLMVVISLIELALFRWKKYI